jgi:hypothetical protein
MPKVEYILKGEKPEDGVVTRDGLIGFAPDPSNAEVASRYPCSGCYAPVTLQWHVLDDLDEGSVEAVPIALTCSDPKCYPYPRRKI